MAPTSSKSANITRSSSASSIGGDAKPVSRLVIAIWSICAVVGQMGISVSLPLYISTFPPTVGPYFALFSNAFLFAIGFSCDALRQYYSGSITGEMITYAKSFKHYKLVLVGSFLALNGSVFVRSYAG